MTNNKSIRNFFICSLILLVIHLGVFAVGNATVQYTIHVDAADLSGFNVEIRISDAKPQMRIAMAAHTEYDDRYWRYIDNVTAESNGKKLKVTHKEDAVWLVEGSDRELTIRYRL